MNIFFVAKSYASIILLARLIKQIKFCLALIIAFAATASIQTHSHTMKSTTASLLLLPLFLCCCGVVAFAPSSPVIGQTLARQQLIKHADGESAITQGKGRLNMSDVAGSYLDSLNNNDGNTSTNGIVEKVNIYTSLCTHLCLL